MVCITFIHGDKKFNYNDDAKSSISSLKHELQCCLSFILEHPSRRKRLNKKYILIRCLNNTGDIQLDVFCESITNEITVRFNVTDNDKILSKIFWKVVKHYVQRQYFINLGLIKE